MKISIWVAGLVLLVAQGMSVLVPAYADTRPVCKYSDSDADGDGFGWENRTTCRITEDTMGPREGGCVDDDGDGWGWDGQRVCRVEVACYDSDPVGDGWGWNGSTSCKVTAYVAPFSELGVLRSKIRSLFGESLAAATLICNYDGGQQVFDMYSNGRVAYTIPGRGKFSGGWSTGFFDDDGIVSIHYSLTEGGRRRARLFMTPDSVTLEGAGPSYNSTDCFWAV